MKKIIPLILIISLTTACIPDNVREKINQGMQKSQQILADQEFKKAIANIELHKLRNGEYPESLSDLQFLSAMDSSIFSMVEYHKLDAGYELNTKMQFPNLDGKNAHEVKLHYPPEFWKGLGCVRSNAK